MSNPFGSGTGGQVLPMPLVHRGAVHSMLQSYGARLALAGLRPSTVSARLTCLRAFERTLVPRTVCEATRWDVEAYLARSLSPESRRAYRSHLRMFYAWALDEGLVEADPTAKLPPIRVPRGTPRPISEPDLTHALALADPRMRAWLLLMALGGLRCIEVAAFRPEDIIESEAGALLYLRECKGGGTGMMPCHPDILEALVVLPIVSGMWWSCSRQRISAEVGRFLRSIGLEATAHQLRHYAGTSWFRASEHDLLATSVLMRHASVRTTQVYAALDPTRPAEIVRRVHLAS